jgi:hypothetical protein
MRQEAVGCVHSNLAFGISQQQHIKPKHNGRMPFILWRNTVFKLKFYIQPQL